MIYETTFLDCVNVPPEMAAQFDRPWNFIGEMECDYPNMVCICEKCIPRPSMRRPQDYERISMEDTYMKVYMQGHLFITDDMIEVFVWFGVCERCSAVYWARSGPPFRRARRYVHA